MFSLVSVCPQSASWLLVLVTVQSVCILPECFLVLCLISVGLSVFLVLVFPPALVSGFFYLVAVSLCGIRDSLLVFILSLHTVFEIPFLFIFL